ncbi:extracellular solute-binding protein [Candidatus Dojkabacteria bacterium]|nr:extracellular solute-binding protein [Candidatus Dojkabacteria bacterium]
MLNPLYLNKLKNIVVLLIAVILLSGCNIFNGNSNGEVINTIDDGRIQGDDASKVIVWGLFETGENLNPLFDSYEVALKEGDDNLQINIEYVQKDEDTYGDDLDSVLNDVDPNNSPDVFMIHSSWLNKYKSKISNVPKEIIPESDVVNDFHSFLANDLIQNGQVVGVPLWVDMLALVYNRTYLLEDSGSTAISNDWNQFLIQAQNMTKYDESNKIIRSGFSAGQSENVEFSFELLDSLFLQARTKPLTSQTLNLPFGEDEKDKAQEVLDWYKSFSNGEKKTWDSSLKLDTALFIEGKLASIVLPSWRILDILQYKEEYDLDLDFAIAQLPQLNPSATDLVSYPSYWIYVVSSDSQNSLSSHKLLKFIVSDDGQNLYHDKVIENGREFSLLSPIKSIAETQANESEYLKPYFEATKNGLRWSMSDGEEIRLEYEKLIKGESTIESLLEAIKNLNSPPSI